MATAAAGASAFAAGASTGAASGVGKFLLGGVAHLEHFALVAYGFAGELVVEVECNLCVGDVDHESFGSLSVGKVHGHILAERYSFAIEFAVGIAEDGFVEWHHQCGVFFAECFFGREGEIEGFALLESFDALREAFNHEEIVAKDEDVGVLFHEFVNGDILLGAYHENFVCERHVFSFRDCIH